MSECGCCSNCGDTPKVSGTEVTLLSGTKPARQNSATAASGVDHRKGVYIVAGSAVAIAAVAFFMTRN